ncbi:MAG: chemotaxis protein CheY [Solirubrobacterales bacterium]|nr:chemotaxis protein CheY [Solirubrobacterales bacterium]
MRVFLCDDNEQYRLLARIVLEPIYEIVGEAGDGVEAIELAPELAPDVVLLDLNMPRLNGHEALPRLRELLPHARLLVLTSGQATDERERALAAGADGFILKPESVYALVGELAAALG